MPVVSKCGPGKVVAPGQSAKATANRNDAIIAAHTDAKENAQALCEGKCQGDTIRCTYIEQEIELIEVKKDTSEYWTAKARTIGKCVCKAR
jgi:ubiquitin